MVYVRNISCYTKKRNSHRESKFKPAFSQDGSLLLRPLGEATSQGTCGESLQGAQATRLFSSLFTEAPSSLVRLTFPLQPHFEEYDREPGCYPEDINSKQSQGEAGAVVFWGYF